MVHRLVFTFVIFIAGAFAEAQSLLKSADAAYVQAVAPRFVKWTFETFGTDKKANEDLKNIARREAAKIDSWYFEIAPGFQIERVQFGAHWKAGQQENTYLLVFPMKPGDVWKELKKIQALPSHLEKNFLGFGFSYQGPELYVFNKREDKAKPALCKTVLNGSRQVSAECLSEISEPAKAKVAFSSLVKKWRVWSGAPEDAPLYELHLDKFNLRFLDGAALDMSRKINNEFLLNNLRIHYRATDDYEILYP